MATAPLIKTPQTDGGTLYTFSSASRDLSRTFNNDNLKLIFSKFVLLNIPDFDRVDPDSPVYNNYMQFDTIDGMIQGGGLKADPNVNLTESLQNYALNLEELILSSTTYDSTVRRSPAERIFFKWLKETGAIRFREATDLERNPALSRPLFTEEDPSSIYQRVVKYIGDIDIVNNVDKAGEAYTELYINIPTEVGNTPTVLFDAISDANYQSNIVIQGSDEYIMGRDASTIQPDGLDILAFYDYDEALAGPSANGGYTDPNANWMDQTDPPTLVDSYFTEPTSFIDPSNVDIIKYPADYGDPGTFSGVAYRRSKLDGISLDFSATDYQQIAADPSISTIQQFNGSDLSNNFEFNAVLIYYDLKDLSDSSKTVTNLYGILLLDNVTPTVDGGFIQRFPKFKPNSITGLNGNSYGFKLNLRFNAASNSSGSNVIVNDYNTFSMGLFSDTLIKLQESVKIFQSQQRQLVDLNAKVNTLEELNRSVPEIQGLQSQINSLQSQIQNASLAFAKDTALIDLIAKNADEIQALANGTTTRTLQYNTDVIRKGPGIGVDKSVPNVIRIFNDTQAYKFMNPLDSDGVSITQNSLLNINIALPQVYADLQPFTNMLRLYTENGAGGDVKIFIDDQDERWKEGQVMRLVFPTEFEIGSQNLKIYTDSQNRNGNGVYGVIMANIGSTQLTETPIIEVICIDPTNYEFTFDVIR